MRKEGGWQGGEEEKVEMEMGKGGRREISKARRWSGERSTEGGQTISLPNLVLHDPSIGLYQ